MKTAFSNSISRASIWLLALSVMQIGCKSFQTNSFQDRLRPSNTRIWSPEFSKTPRAEINGDVVTVRNIRNTQYFTETDFTLNHYDKTYDLNQIKSVDYIVVPFQNANVLAHTMLSFGFENDEYLCVSAEIRTEHGEEYSPMLGILNQFEITYVVADERDLIRLRTRHRDAEVFIYPTVAKGESAKRLFLDVMNRVNHLDQNPEFYNTIANNCTTSILRHVNKVSPGRVPYSLAVLFPGLSDRYAYELGLLDRRYPFKELKQRAKVNDLAERHYEDDDFSRKIRANLR